MATDQRLIKVPPDIHRELKIAAAQRETTISALVAAILKRWLSRQDKAA